ncbi:hypothetical protein IE81DRAFT_62665 [Ceraceosorus guamensis]|uniref:Uncharacterized protein n=1 Tax=Ceraceosorus guamensis TaxID=1522189 RepID=A0A316VPG6_9BASI|nr:hypothetical protein IE81DRAFT_62665 [Ceraceosorus guamensis]PWN38968.1 hypothetical protein IE81DRAFT_62665 [Ceraceosorus guamensis]
MEEAEEENEEEEGRQGDEEQKHEDEDEDEEIDQLRSQSSPSKSQEKARTITEPGQIRNNVIEKQQATSSSLAAAEDEALVSEQLGPVVEISSTSLLHSDRDPESQLQDYEAGSRVPDTSQRAVHHRAKASMRDEASAENQVPNFLAGITSPTPTQGKTNMLPTSSPQVAVMMPAITATPKELSGRTYASIAVGPSQPLRLEDSDEIAARAARVPRRSVPAVLVEAQTASTSRAPRQPRHTTATGAQEAKAGSSVLPRRAAMRDDGLLVHTPIQEEQRAPHTAALIKKRKLARTEEDDGGREGAISPEKRQEVEEWRERSSAELSRSASEESPRAERRAKRRRGPEEEKEEAEARAEFMREVQAFKKDYAFEMIAQVMPVLGDECDVNKARGRMERRIARWSNEYGIGRRDILILIKQAKGNLRLAEELMAQ